MAHLATRPHISAETDIAKLCGPPLARGGEGRIYKHMDKKEMVFKVVDVPLGKLLDVGLVTDTLLRLRHPNVVHYESHRLIEKDTKLLLEMEKMDGNLYELQESHKTPTVFWMLLLDVASALKELKAYDVLHRDVNPSNILFKRGVAGVYRFKLADFGIAKICDSSNTQGVGTRGFIAPEVIGGTACGHEADVWSFGASIRTIFSTLMDQDKDVKILVKEMMDTSAKSRATPPRLEQFARAAGHMRQLTRLNQIQTEYDTLARLHNAHLAQVQKIKKNLDALRGEAEALLSPPEEGSVLDDLF